MKSSIARQLSKSSNPFDPRIPTRLGIFGLILGGLSIPLFWVFAPLTIWLGTIGLIFSLIGVGFALAQRGHGILAPIFGAATSAVSLLVVVIWIIFAPSVREQFYFKAESNQWNSEVPEIESR